MVARVARQTYPKRRLSMVLEDSRLFKGPLGNADFRQSRFSQETAEKRRNPQEAADWRSSPWVRPLKRGPTKESGARFEARFFTPDIPQSEIVATNFYDWAKSWAKSWAKKLGEISDEIFWTFSRFIRRAERPTKISPQIPPSLSLHVLSRLLGLKSQNFISASFWGLGCPTNLGCVPWCETGFAWCESWEAAGLGN